MNIVRPHAVPQTPKTQRKRAIPTTHISKLSRVKRIASKKRGRNGQTARSLSARGGNQTDWIPQHQ